MQRDPFVTILRGLSWAWIGAYGSAAVLIVTGNAGGGDFAPIGLVALLPLLGVICAPAVLVLRYMDPLWVQPRLDDQGFS